MEIKNVLEAIERNDSRNFEQIINTLNSADQDNLKKCFSEADRMLKESMK